MGGKGKKDLRMRRGEAKYPGKEVGYVPGDTRKGRTNREERPIESGWTQAHYREERRGR